MQPTVKTKLTSRQRLARGLRHTATGPVDVTRGAVGLSIRTALLITVITAVTMVGAVAAIVIIRRSMRPNKTSPRPPSVDVQPSP